MVRRRSMMSTAENPMASVTAGEPNGIAGNKRCSNAPDYTLHGTTPSGSMMKHSDEEERLDGEVELTKSSSRDQEKMIRRAS